MIAAAVAAAVSLVMSMPGLPVAGRPRPGPALSQAQAQAMLPVIDAYLDRHAGRLGFGGDLSSQLKPRTFCDASIVEIRRDESPGRPGIQGAGIRAASALWHVGIVMNCGEFARRGHTLLEGSAGYPGIGEVITLAGRAGRYQARSLDVGPSYADRAWVRGHFSPGAAAVIMSDQATAPDPVRQACQAFGFPPATRAVRN